MGKQARTFEEGKLLEMDLLIFDLDGTLIDSKQDIVNGVNAARGNFGLPALDVATIASYVGHGAPMLIRKALGPEASDATVCPEVGTRPPSEVMKRMLPLPRSTM